MANVLLSQLFLRNIVNSSPEFKECLDYLKENYYPNASMIQYLDIVLKIAEFKTKNSRFPDRNEFFMIFRLQCLCPYYVEDEYYLMACEFFINNQVDITSLSCMTVYNFYEFYLIERRIPRSIQEFESYMRRTIIASINPESITNDTIPRPLDKEKVDFLKEKMFIYKKDEDNEEKSCSICQDDFQDGQKCIKLDCNHCYHGDEKECCETGTIFKWFEENKNCPMCRKEF